jgi:hypothetical protein
MSVCKRIWLTLAKNGRMTAKEVREAVQIDGGHVDMSLSRMFNGGMIVRFGEKPSTYGVTSTCITPRMTSVAEILEAVNGAKQ